ncbi:MULTISPECIES: BON domain-containing protein [unclassified Rhizobium]|uniref:BON domain-containing protein n=1 Tax=unclassified Rhizobium TaxID=2613769 RepID=UPI001611E978|nr:MULTISPECIES: BON domain-containing protein [unclassified Rhizobium]MBB3320123.1 osmotically-inducible protein OsmY [Rhizobium sp. BK181]MBB3545282.1 osmotically-inducible protein OsmY [Rhizobium sp. BK399]MCS3743259.1 osmotically-inducible protein OsmY [Rhizobium sp. BK661]
MNFGSDSFSHEQHCASGHSSASTIASVQAALSADLELDSSSITVKMIGPVVLLEGYINNSADRERAIAVAASIVGAAHLQDRMFARVFEP